MKLLKNHPRKTGFSFGITTAIITTLGMLVGISASTNSKLAVIGGVISIAVADAFSDAMGIHISEESEGVHTSKEIWEATASTFFTKIGFGLTFVIPVLLLELSAAIMVSVCWGILVLGSFSFYLAKKQKIKPYKVVAEHLAIAAAVIIITHYLGKMIYRVFV